MRNSSRHWTTVTGGALCLIALSAFVVSSPRSAGVSPLAGEGRYGRAAALTREAALGRRIFEDRNLSLERNQSCASCHAAAWGFSSPSAGVNASGAVMPGSVPTRFGNRKPPSAAYATASPVLHYDATDSGWVGGDFWDGRATGRRLGSPAPEQALLPFLNPAEQALPDAACVVYRVAYGPYAELAAAVLHDVLEAVRFPDNTDRLCEREGSSIPLSATGRARVLAAYDAIGRSVAAFEDSPAVSQFSSKYDAYLAGRATLTADERAGMALYKGKAKCASCHPNAAARALFTDYTYDNIGVPANPGNPALRARPEFRDLGLGGVLHDSALRGAQKVPTLRNLDKRGLPGAAKAYMHNGYFKTVEDVVHFYNTRDVLPRCEDIRRPSVGLNCWPAPEVAENVNREELGNLHLTAREEHALVSYLRTLNDGYDTPRTPGR